MGFDSRARSERGLPVSCQGSDGETGCAVKNDFSENCGTKMLIGSGNETCLTDWKTHIIFAGTTNIYIYILLYVYYYYVYIYSIPIVNIIVILIIIIFKKY